MTAVVRCFLDEFDFIAFGGIDEGKSTSSVFHVWAVGVFNAVRVDVFFKFLKAVDLEGKVCQIFLYLHATATGVGTNLDFFFAVRSSKKNQLRTPR